MEQLEILFCTSEVAPFSKTGGLADVSASLPAALAELGQDVRVVTPLYGTIDRDRYGLEPVTGHRGGGQGRARGKEGTAAALEGRLPGTSVPVIFVGNDRFFARQGLYQEAGIDYADNLQRFACLSRAACELAASHPRPRIIHVNDWQTALVPVYLRTDPVFARVLRRTASVLTIHNLGYQGLFERSGLPSIGLSDELFTIDGLEYYGRLNVLKGGLQFADALTTVSPTYAREIQTPEYGCGLEGVLARRSHALRGILNGIDVAAWDPAQDARLAATFDADNLAGKRLCKQALQRELGLAESEAPLLAVISRLDPQKGCELLVDVIPELVRRELQIVVLGVGAADIEQQLAALAGQHHQLAVRLAFDVDLAHLIEAGADIFLMPSRYEPCGLNQMYSQRYGTVPVVRRTGGLADTVVAYEPSTCDAGRATGFQFEHYGARDLLNAVLLALSVYEAPDAWARLMRAGMRQDFSWQSSAGHYLDVYRTALAARSV